MLPRSPHPLVLLSMLGLLLGVAACSSDDTSTNGGSGPVIPENADLSIRFMVYQTGDTERLLWKGTAEGPDADSPQRLATPQIPAAEPFRVDWEQVDASVPILGYQLRATQDPSEGDLRLPRDENDEAVWGEVQSFSYENSTPIEMITERCPAGGDCPEVLLWDSTQLHSLWVFAGTADSQETSLDEARLDFEIVNVAPSTELIEDGTYPYWRVDGQLQSVLAPGDTIPAGATVVFKLSGVDPDPVVLKMALPHVRYQGVYQLEGRSGPLRQLSTFYSTPSEADTLTFTVGPFSYTFFGRAVDRLRAVDPTPVSFEFHAGFAPSMVEVLPEIGDEVLLRDPLDGTWPQNTVDYGAPLQNEKRYWDGRRFYESNLAGTEEWTGTVFRIPMTLRGQADPREPASAGYGEARAFTYQWYSENDPNNTLSDGGGYDDPDRFNQANFTNEFRLENETGIEIFVPSIFWLDPTLFDEGSCDNSGGLDFCGVGELLRQQLGQITVEGRARHTANNQLFRYWSGTVEDDGSPLTIPVDEWGLTSAPLSSSFPMHLGLDDGSGGVEYWPAAN